MELVFENQHWACVDKPADCLSVPSRMGTDDARPVVGRLLEAKLGVRLWPVHRLDFEVSGLLLFAKDADAHRAASRWFENHEVLKTYIGWVHLQEARDSANPPEAGSATMEWTSRLLRGKKRAYEHAAGKECLTRATPGPTKNWRGGDYRTWTLQPMTGRSHQLRFEMTKHAGPLAGDELYGSRLAWPLPGIALRSTRIEFRDPAAQQKWKLPGALEIPGFL